MSRGYRSAVIQKNELTLLLIQYKWKKLLNASFKGFGKPSVFSRVDRYLRRIFFLNQCQPRKLHIISIWGNLTKLSLSKDSIIYPLLEYQECFRKEKTGDFSHPPYRPSFSFTSSLHSLPIYVHTLQHFSYRNWNSFLLYIACRFDSCIAVRFSFNVLTSYFMDASHFT